MIVRSRQVSYARSSSPALDETRGVQGAPEFVKGITIILIRAFALLDDSREGVSPFGEEAISLHLRVYERQVKSFNSGQCNRFLKDALSAADINLTRQLICSGNSVGQLFGDLHAIACERAIAREDDDLAIFV